MRATSGRQCGFGFMSVVYAFTVSALVNPTTFKPEFNSADTKAAVEFFVKLLKNAPPDVTTYIQNGNIPCCTSIYTDSELVAANPTYPSN